MYGEEKFDPTPYESHGDPMVTAKVFENELKEKMKNFEYTKRVLYRRSMPLRRKLDEEEIELFDDFFDSCEDTIQDLCEYIKELETQIKEIKSDLKELLADSFDDEMYLKVDKVCQKWKIDLLEDNDEK